mmetsp:Transcript_3162/g.4887  ORF Transcript_3162/g.4887 Transcript_3162/m.4887 type:complete len:394 (+) Transcript_3162:1557-2738(+)|eukprot:CAMPEP_0171455148 /NCGR_PEP_ID=MMETSP0945-20130129/2160_1 /TAXON_ID=109269 /ORGANISM="Vaucheria litorea, Strain CCMP2940" /LENGTH=393 /DNA_ID=CAMNT_0011980333 /DNA_START=1554 /DNA_END=2735 /DNA_ORIENTATION=-
MDLYADLPAASGPSSSISSPNLCIPSYAPNNAPEKPPPTNTIINKGAKMRSWAQTRHAQMLSIKRNNSSQTPANRPTKTFKQTTTVRNDFCRENFETESDTKLDEGFQDVVISDPYHPVKPNDYMAFCRYRLEKKKQEERDKELAEIMKEQEIERKELEKKRFSLAKKFGQTNDSVIAEGLGRGRGVGRGISNLPAWMTKGKDALKGSNVSIDTSMSVPNQFQDTQAIKKSSNNDLLAAKIMGKMGWEEGQGLGVNNQGLSQPIIALSTGGGTGKIQMHPTDHVSQPKKKGLFSNPTKVILLKNMVAPGEVDSELENEVKDECLRFGPIKKCLIKEYKGITPEDAVWTFIAFEKQESAVNAYLDMNGRFFGGRKISASFYEEDKFDKGEYGPQ